MTNSTSAPSPDRAEKNEKLGNELTLLAGQLNAGSYRMIKLIAQFDERKAWGDGGGVKSCAHWLNWKCGIDMGAAREKVRVAHCLQDLPLIDASFATGEISYSRVRAMTGAPAARLATPETEEALQSGAPEVDAKTCVTRWQGERCDYSMAIDGLMKVLGTAYKRRVGPPSDGGCQISMALN